MDAIEIKSKLHSYIDQAEQPFLRIVEVMFEQYFKEQEQDKILPQITDQKMIEEAEQPSFETSIATRPDVMNAVTPIRPFVSLDEIVAQQQYQPITYEEFRSIADEIKIEEPIEELLGMLTK